MNVSGSHDTLHEMLTTGESDVCGFVHGEKFICKLYSIYKKIYYFYSDAGTHSKCGIFTVKKNSNFYYFRSKF